MTGNFLKLALVPALVASMLAVVAAPGTAADSKAAPAANLEESNKEKLRKFFEEVVNQRNMAAFDNYVAKTVVDHQEMPGYTTDYAGVKKYFTDVAAAFPDLKVTVDLVLADGDLVAASCTWTGINKGPFMGGKPTGKSVTFRSMEVVRIQDGKCVEHWGVAEDLALMTQLGLVHMGH